VIPGTRQVVWFKAVKQGNYEIVCTELCGWGHYKMKGRLVVESQSAYEAYLNKLKVRQFQRQYSPENDEAEFASQREPATESTMPVAALVGDAS
jgi:cytochrome c oxidase subunit 2